MRRSAKIWLVVFLVVVILAVLGWRGTRLPRPQIAFTAGQVAPDFTLSDQAGQPFRLADQRGHKVVLIFYRGYW